MPLAWTGARPAPVDGSRRALNSATVAAPCLNNSTKNQRPSGVKRDGPQERNAAESVPRLQRGILRLALGFHGQNAELDAKLKQLGVMIRGGQRDGSLQQLIDEIVDTIVSLNIERKPSSGAATATTPDFLTHFLDHMEAPEKLLVEVDAVKRALSEKRETAAALAAIERAAGEFSKDLGRSEATGTAVRSMRRCLAEMLERMPVSRALSGDAAGIKRSLEAAREPAAFKPCADAIAALVIRLREELQAELDTLAEFLRGTSRRLLEFEQMMDRSREHYAEHSADAMQLSNTVMYGISGMKEEIAIADDLETLKASVSSRLDGIDQSLTTFMVSQSKRAGEATEAFERMTSKLKDLETQAEQLRGDLEQQHARILIDPLTGVLNRAGYNEMAAKQYARWKRYGGSLSLAVIDLDLFKDINDRYGHSAGDRVLATVASKLVELIRESDVLCRYGGEEFVLLLPETGIVDGAGLLEKLRSSIELCPFRHKDTPVRVTMSCGITQFSGNDNLDDVFERADKAMYQAKAAGRNRICIEESAAQAAGAALRLSA